MPNNLDRDQFRQDVRDVNYAARRTVPSALIWIAVLVGVFALLGAITWGVKVATSDIKGAGDQTRIVNDGRNRINAQEWFAGQYEQIKSTDRRIGEASAALAKAPDDEIAKTNYAGLVNRCMEMVGNYNAEANKVSRGKWLDSAIYPFQIDNNDPTTDCKESAK